ncbi:Glutaredoxin-2 [Leucoagaricus sp. SymC.cos]|nr:Glutaredoxin-2 [Leucoagaricus sp. SymC.cos]
MLSHLRTSLSARISSAVSFTWFSTTASLSSPSLAQLKPMSTKDLVEKAIANNKIAIFSKSWCPFCARAKALLKEKYPEATSVIFELDEREDGADIQNYLHQKTLQRTVPNIFIGP